MACVQDVESLWTEKVITVLNVWRKCGFITEKTGSFIEKIIFVQNVGRTAFQKKSVYAQNAEQNVQI